MTNPLDAEVHPRKRPTGRNADFSWDDFDSESYTTHNYAVLRWDDRSVLELVRDYFEAVAPGHLVQGVDVGSGSNIYPALTLLPWCKEISMIEQSARNVAWLTNEIRSYNSTWDPFWDVLRSHPGYQTVTDPRATLATHARISQGSVFDLERGRWDIGTMFFVAESLTSERSEFDRAVGCFLAALRPGAPFAAAFMEGSEGYTVGTREFPAVAIDADDVHACLVDQTKDLHVDRVGIIGGDVLLREGYTGMVLARGMTKN
jgi:hypothetical protein